MLEVKYRITADDLAAYSLYVLRRSPTSRRNFFSGWASWLLMAVLVSAGAYLLNPDSPVWVLLGAGGLTVVGLFPFVYRSSVRNSLSRHAGELACDEKLTLTLTDEGLRKTTEDEELFIRWRAVKELAVQPEHAYLLMHKGGVVILPQRGFERAEDYAAVRDLVLSKVGTSS